MDVTLYLSAHPASPCLTICMQTHPPSPPVFTPSEHIHTSTSLHLHSCTHAQRDTTRQPPQLPTSTAICHPLPTQVLQGTWADWHIKGTCIRHPSYTFSSVPHLAASTQNLHHPPCRSAMCAPCRRTSSTLNTSTTVSAPIHYPQHP